MAEWLLVPPVDLALDEAVNDATRELIAKHLAFEAARRAHGVRVKREGPLCALADAEARVRAELERERGDDNGA